MGFMAYAINKYQFKFGVTLNFVSVAVGIYGYHKLFTYGLKKDKFIAYDEIYKANFKEV